MLKLAMDYKMTKNMLNNGTLNGSRTWLLVRTWHCYFISFNSEHPVYDMVIGHGSRAVAALGLHNPSVDRKEWRLQTGHDETQPSENSAERAGMRTNGTVRYRYVRVGGELWATVSQCVGRYSFVAVSFTPDNAFTYVLRQYKLDKERVTGAMTAP